MSNCRTNIGDPTFESVPILPQAYPSRMSSTVMKQISSGHINPWFIRQKLTIRSNGIHGRGPVDTGSIRDSTVTRQDRLLEIKGWTSEDTASNIQDGCSFRGGVGSARGNASWTRTIIRINIVHRNDDDIRSGCQWMVLHSTRFRIMNIESMS